MRYAVGNHHRRFVRDAPGGEQWLKIGFNLVEQSVVGARLQRRVEGARVEKDCRVSAAEQILVNRIQRARSETDRIDEQKRFHVGGNLRDVGGKFAEFEAAFELGHGIPCGFHADRSVAGGLTDFRHIRLDAKHFERGNDADNGALLRRGGKNDPRDFVFKQRFLFRSQIRNCRDAVRPSRGEPEEKTVAGRGLTRENRIHHRGFFVDGILFGVNDNERDFAV